MRTTIRLDDDLLREAKAYAAATDRTLTRVIEDALREVLIRRRQAAGRPKVELPTDGGGGLQPGVNLDSNAALWDLMDGLDDPS
ncbi:MAG: transcriptional regulator, CopG family [Geminicoccaceae bacterium]|nr:transcriptional regulator, CopG family [Geminicoccaceae bacterium]